MKYALSFAALLASCDPVWQLNVVVHAPGGAPVDNAALVLTGCPDQNEHDNGTVAALTDKEGRANVGGSGYEYPACAITIAKPGYALHETTFDELCHGDRDDCDRSRRDITLEPEP